MKRGQIFNEVIGDEQQFAQFSHLMRKLGPLPKLNRERETIFK
jgi:hypothetical protein